GSAFLLVALASAAMDYALAAQLDREQDELLADKARILTMLLRDRPGDVRALKQETEWEWAVSEHARVAMRILGPGGATELESPGMAERLPPGVFPPPAPAEDESGSGAVVRTPGGPAYRVRAVRAEPGRVVQLALDRGHDDELLTGYRRRLAVVLGVALAACALAGHRLARRGLRPLNEV